MSYLNVSYGTGVPGLRRRVSVLRGFSYLDEFLVYMRELIRSPHTILAFIDSSVVIDLFAIIDSLLSVYYTDAFSPVFLDILCSFQLILALFRSIMRISRTERIEAPCLREMTVCRNSGNSENC